MLLQTALSFFPHHYLYHLQVKDVVYVFGIYNITESQTGQGWQGPLWVTQPNPLPKQGHPEQAAQHRVQAGLEYTYIIYI